MGDIVKVEYNAQQLQEDKNKIWKLLPIGKEPIKLWTWLPKIAGIIFFLSSVYYFSRSSKITPEIVSNITPAGNKAVLILADGSKISLTDVKNGTVAQQNGVKVLKTKDGQLIYEAAANQPSGKSLVQTGFNMIKIPNGGHYQVRLPDGTVVQLNAASSLRYPASFATLKERKVELTGEAYFEVKKDKTKPFRVSTGKQVVEVLGTHFNINGYVEEPEIKTTLLEGSVKVYSSVVSEKGGAVLKPGQLSKFNSNGQFHVMETDTAQAVAWKNGDFQFDGEDLKTVMRVIARWYDVEVVYETDVPKKVSLQGWVSRKSNLGSVLSMIENIGGVHFKVEGRRIMVMK